MNQGRRNFLSAAGGLGFLTACKREGVSTAARAIAAPTSTTVHVVCHGMMLFKVSRSAGVIEILIPEVPDMYMMPGHVYKAGTRGSLGDLAGGGAYNLKGVTAANPAGVVNDINSSVNLNFTNCSPDLSKAMPYVNVRLPMPENYLALRAVTNAGLGGPAVTTCNLNPQTFSIVHVFRYSNYSAPLQLVDTAGATLWTGSPGNLNLQIYAEPQKAPAKSNMHLMFLNAMFNPPLGLYFNDPASGSINVGAPADTDGLVKADLYSLYETGDRGGEPTNCTSCFVVLP